MSRMLRGFCKCVLAITAITIVTSALYLPEARLPVVIWLLSVALMWRPSPGRDG